MGDFLMYKGYKGSVEYSEEDHCLYGKVLGISSLLSYEGETLEELERDFRRVVEEFVNPFAPKAADDIYADLEESRACYDRGECNDFDAAIEGISIKYGL